ncbi:methyltransferase domain-containing protein [Dokdonella sp.]|uniref:methyltransferase domain-containing protein n=1 Tax=Dokdonella sp. TaxID=2291710 RepID=UPI002614B386|nr:methyltransferase domain-containing protein [Dokdonella sp.]
MTNDVNSHEYWNERFRTDWNELGGPQQTEMFARVALRMMPAWLCADIQAHARSMLDAGCAEGEAVALLRNRFGPHCRVEGMDFSEEAIARARAKHGDGDFRTGDLSELDSHHDVIFSSNTLEHFRDPLQLLERWSRQARDHLVLLVPFWEWNRDPEHAFTFEHSSLPAVVGGRLVCTHVDVQNTARLPQTRWNGHQALIVYSSPEAIARSRLSVDALGDGLLPGSLSAEDIVAARAFGTTMSHAAALADEDPRAEARDQRVAQTLEAVNTLSRAIGEQSAQLQQEREAGERIRSDLVHLMDRLQAMQEAVARGDERLAAMQDELASVQPVASLKEAVAQAQDNLFARIEASARRTDAAFQRQSESLGEKIHVLEAQIGAQREAQRLHAELEALREKQAAADLELGRLAVAERLLKQELERERGKMAELLDSSSWRLTGPLRTVATGWYRLRGNPRLRAVPDAPVAGTLAAGAPATIPATATPPPLADIAVVDEHRAALRDILDRHAGQPVVVLRPVVDWDLPLFQRPHHIALRLARAGYLYFYCTPNGRDGVNGFRRIDDNLYLTDQFLLVNRIAGGKILHLYSTDNHCTTEYVQERVAAGDRLMYEYIDEIHPTISGFEIPPHVMEKHALLLERPDVLCVASADKLHNEVRAVRDTGLVMATNGVEHEHFHGRGRENPPAAIADLVALGKPIIGYFGAFAVWFDYELVARLAATRPDYTILLLGWDYDGSLDRSGIKHFPNVHVLGPIPYRELPDYARFFDVSTIPFLINDVTESTSPIKLFEYMSLEHPIVTTNMPECRKYASVMVARDHGEFVALVDRALDLRGDVATLELLRSDARANTWDSKASAIADGIARQWPEYAPAAKRQEKAA